MDKMLPFNKNNQSMPGSNTEGFMPFRCEVCECPFFDKTHVIMKRSKIVSPTGQDEFRPKEVFRCENCGWILGAPYDEATKKEVQARMAALMKAQEIKEKMTHADNKGDIEIGVEETVEVP